MYRLAIQDLDKAIQLNLDDPAIAYYHRSIAHSGLGPSKQELADERKACQLDPRYC